MLLVCTNAMKQESLFLPLTANNYAVCFDEKRMEKVFWRFCGFIIMFKSCVILKLNKRIYIYVLKLNCYASSSRKDDVMAMFL